MNMAKSSVAKCCGKPEKWPRFMTSRFCPQLSSGPAGGNGGQARTSGDCENMVLPKGPCMFKCTNQARCVLSSSGTDMKTVPGALASGAQITEYHGMT